MQRRSIDLQAIIAMSFLCAVMGAQQVAIKGVSSDMYPLMQLAFRSGMAAILVVILMVVTKEAFSFRDGSLFPGVCLGVLFALEYVFLGEALRHIAASRVVVFLYTAPLFAAVTLSWIRPDERLRPLQWVGLLVAFLGIVLTFLAPSNGGVTGARLWLGDALGILAGAAWGFSTVVIRTTKLAEVAPSKTLLYQLVIAFIVLQLSAIALDQTSFTLTKNLIINLAFQSIVVSFLCFLLWVGLLKRYIASELGVLSFLTPLFGVAFGVYFLDENVSLKFIVGSILVLFGILLVSSQSINIRRRHPN